MMMAAGSSSRFSSALRRADEGARLYRAPGRVNIIGEHTDYTGGLVLPTATALYTQALVTGRDDGIFRVHSISLDDVQHFSLSSLRSGGNPKWTDYIKGVVAGLGQRGVTLGGADIVIDSDIPIGGGLSSSAALETVIAIALLDLANSHLLPIEIAALCRQAEIQFAGVNCGVMDQFAVACCVRDHASLLDCRDMSTTHVKLPASIRFILADSGVKHALPDGEYNERSKECREATAILTASDPTIVTLRDLDLDTLENHREALGETLYRRCHHVVSENRRVVEAVSALESENAQSLGNLVNESHRSLRDDFETSCDAVETLVKIANTCSGVRGSRIIGGGFGGCVLSVVDASCADAAAKEIGNEYGSTSGHEPWVHIVSQTDAARRVAPR